MCVGEPGRVLADRTGTNIFNEIGLLKAFFDDLFLPKTPWRGGSRRDTPVAVALL